MPITRSPNQDKEDYEKSLMVFLGDLEVAHSECDSALISLESDPSNADLTKNLFKSIHNIKEGLNVIGLAELTPMIDAVENIIALIKTEKLRYDDVLGDLILLAMDLSRVEVASRLGEDQSAVSTEQLEKITGAIDAVAKADKLEYRDLVREAVILMDPDTSLSLDDEQDASNQIYDTEDILYACGITIDDDIRFLMRQAHAIDERSQYWQGRSDRVLLHTLMLNAACKKPVNQHQLTVAVLTHDVGMAYLPLKLLHKQDKLTQEERNLVHIHPEVSSQLISGLKRWQQAAEIIKHHHEHVNGDGYPNKLSGGDICVGAKMLAITDAFEACTHNRAYATRIKRPTLRAILALHHNAGTQFDEKYVSIFTQMIRKEQQTSKDILH